MLARKSLQGMHLKSGSPAWATLRIRCPDRRRFSEFRIRAGRGPLPLSPSHLLPLDIGRHPPDSQFALLAPRPSRAAETAATLFNPSAHRSFRRGTFNFQLSTFNSALQPGRPHHNSPQLSPSGSFFEFRISHFELAGWVEAVTTSARSPTPGTGRPRPSSRWRSRRRERRGGW